MKRLLILFLLLFSASSIAAETPKLQVGDTAPDLLGYSAAGERLSAEALKGRIIIVTFWATWCGPCRRELPILNAIQQRISDDRLKVIAINYEQGRSQFNQIERTLKDWSLTLSYDPRGRAARAFGVDGIPHMVVIGRDGRIAVLHVGYSKDAVPGIIDELNKLLSAPTPGAE